MSVIMDTLREEHTITDNYLHTLPLMGSPLPVVTILLSYLVFVNIIGPSYMKNRPAFNLNKFLIIYNAVQVVYSIYVFSLGVRLIMKHGLFDRNCTSKAKENYSNLLYAGYCYFVAKVTELLDTIFFVLRKKQNQVTFLHIYHHSCMVICVWAFMMYDTSYCSTFLGTANSFIHIVMYGYYGLSAIPAMRNFLWWKKYLTSMQLIQFGLVFIHLLVYSKFTKCPPSNSLYITSLFNVVLFLYLFSNFYRNAYLNKKKVRINADDFVCSNANDNNESAIDDVSLVNGNGTVKAVNGSSKQHISNGVSLHTKSKDN